MAMESKQKEKSRVIIYIGSDARFCQLIEDLYKETYPAVDWKFVRISAEQADPRLGIQTLFSEIVALIPRIVYCDFSQGESKDLHFLVELMARDTFFSDVPLCGLVDSKKRAMSTDCSDADLVFVKGVETFDLMNTPMSITFPKMVKPVKFAKAKVSKPVRLTDDFRLGFVTDSIIHLESNLPLQENDTVTLGIDLPRKSVPSKKFKVKSKSQSDLFYRYKYAYDLTYNFVDEPQFDNIVEEDGDAQSDTAEKKSVEEIRALREEKERIQGEHKDKIEWCKKKHKEWVLYSANDSGQKGTKILVIDQKVRVLNDPESGDIRKQPFAFRFQTGLDEELSEIESVRPIFIAYQMFSMISKEDHLIFRKALDEVRLPEEERSARNTMAKTREEKLFNMLLDTLPDIIKSELNFIGNLIKKIKSITNFKPVVLLYNSYFADAKGLQDSYQYELITTKKEPMELASIVKIADTLEKKRKDKQRKIIENKISVLKKTNPQKFRSLTVSDFNERRFYIKKMNALSFGTVEIDVTITAMTESELLFTTPLILPHKSYRLNYPIDMSIYLVTIDGVSFVSNGDLKTYRALIHSIDEHDKMKLREAVNQIFFAPLMEQREKESADYWKKHEEKLAAKTTPKTEPNTEPNTESNTEDKEDS
jgi:hypothetical protein